MEVHSVSYSVKGRQLVNNISLRLNEHKLLAIVGPNGAGKSTLLKLLTRELNPTAGTVYFGGKNLREYSHLELARKRAVLSQQNKLSLPFEVQEVVMMGRYPFHKNAPEEADYMIVEECLRRVDMLGFAKRTFTTLSGGEQQRVQLAKSLAQIWSQKGAFLFLDEPTNGLDLRHQYLALEIAKELTRKGWGVVAVLHDLNMAMYYADEVLMLQKGTVRSLGKPEDVFTPDRIMEVFDVAVALVKRPDTNEVVIVPKPEELLGNSNPLT